MVIPLLSNLGPLRSVVATSLRDSLDVFRKKKYDDLTVQITKLENLGVSPTQLLVGVIFTVFGFIIYYFVPMAVFFKNMDLYFFIMLSILFAMIVGMIFMG